MELNKIYNQDCLVGIKEIKDKSVNVILTDPPYLYLNHKLDRPFDENELFKEWDRVLKEDGFIVVFGRGESFHRWNYMLNQMGWKFKEEIIWDKRYTSNPLQPIARKHETISILSKKGSLKKHKVPYLDIKKYDVDKIEMDIKRIKSSLNNTKAFDEILDYLESGKENRCMLQTTKHALSVDKSFKNLSRQIGTLKSITKGMNEQSIITVKRDGRKSLIHPTQKPVELMERLLMCVSEENDTVLDCFVGSGSVPIACINQNLNYIGFEIDKEYYELAKERIDNHIKQLSLM
ncbi:DNA-methyltransferase [Enterococcus cecorum]|uniref:DNA-methyltransferase n=1 Tax=Enterococcus cecorum TaxID=44008 RepID=UPI001C0EC7A2|nr:site-specific DNA-methyltransferase [Enterococcus cecorum]